MRQGAAEGEFRWPPGPPAPASTTPPPPAIAIPGPSRWDLIEQAWLDRRAGSFRHRTRTTGWTPDPESAYCPRCGESVGPFEADADGCGTCRERRPPWQMTVRLGEYDGLLRSAIHELKFSAWRRIGRELGAELGRAVVERLRGSEWAGHEVVFVPVPTSYRRRISRGIDHTLVLTRSAASTARARVCRALSREHRPEQWAVSPSERVRNVSGAFRPHRRLGRLSDPGPVIVLMDDVRTSGATMRAAARTLLAGRRARGLSRPPAVVCAVVAVSSDRSRRIAADGMAQEGVAGLGEPRNLERMR